MNDPFHQLGLIKQSEGYSDSYYAMLELVMEHIRSKAKDVVIEPPKKYRHAGAARPTRPLGHWSSTKEGYPNYPDEGK